MSTGMNRRSSRTYASRLDDEWQLDTNWTAKPTWKVEQIFFFAFLSFIDTCHDISVLFLHYYRVDHYFCSKCCLIDGIGFVVVAKPKVMFSPWSRYLQWQFAQYYCVTTFTPEKIQEMSWRNSEMTIVYSDPHYHGFILFENHSKCLTWILQLWHFYHFLC